MDFDVEKSVRAKNTYLGDWQLNKTFSKLDNYLNPTNRDMVISYALPVSLENYSPAKFIDKSNNFDLDAKKDELLVYSGFLKNLTSYLVNNDEKDVLLFLFDSVNRIHNSALTNSPLESKSSLFKEFISNKSFVGQNNISDYMQQKGSSLYSKVKDAGPLTGNRVIANRNYHILSGEVLE
jgi:uncharacterized protein YktA (UPF0223 family)